MTARAWTLALLLAGPGAHADARTDYMLNCQGCHADDGRGSPGHVPDLRNELGLLLRVPGGREYLVQVPGSRNAAIDDAALAAVLNWMLPAFSPATLPADFTPYTGSEIGRLRSAPFENTAAVRVQLLEAIADQSH
jgi:mono/diheme cytochrome c family protein